MRSCLRPFKACGYGALVVALAVPAMVRADVGEADSKSEQNTGLPWYVAANASLNLNQVGKGEDKAEFKPVTLGLKLGKYIQRQVALELFGAKGVVGDDDLGIDMKMISNLGVVGRFESPERDGMKIHLQVGYGATELEMRRSTTSLPDRELYHGAIFGGGAEFRLGDGPYFINIQGLRQYSQDQLSIDTGSVELRYEF